MKEIWKDIAGYEGLYQISNIGMIKSLCNGKERILKAGNNGLGYMFVYLCNDGKKKMYYIHRLLAEAFIPNPDNLPTVDHIDRNRTNNTVENLRWATQKEQIANSNRTNQKIAVAKSNSIPVSQYTKSGVFVATYTSGLEAERQTGICNQNISHCLKGRYKSAGNYIWKYA